jgi:hypothetical protein
MLLISSLAKRTIEVGAGTVGHRTFKVVGI